MSPKETVDMEIEALENALDNPRDRADYMSDFWSNADVLLAVMKMLSKGEVKHEQRISKAS